MKRLAMSRLRVSFAILLLSISAGAGAETFIQLHEFGNSAFDGETPSGSLIQGTDGNFYGVTFLGGVNDAGVIFKMTTHGAVTTLYSFCAQGSFPNCPDGDSPVGLIQGTDGNFLRYNGRWRVIPRRWHGIQDHAKRNARDASHLLHQGHLYLVPGWRRAQRADSRHRWQFLRHNIAWRAS